MDWNTIQRLRAEWKQAAALYQECSAHEVRCEDELERARDARYKAGLAAERARTDLRKYVFED